MVSLVERGRVQGLEREEKGRETPRSHDSSSSLNPSSSLPSPPPPACLQGYQMSIYNQILYVQSCSACISLFSLVVNGQLAPALSFVQRHPEALYSIATFSAAATIAQLFISHTIRTFGALVFATVMTTRQFISILLSCVLFAHPLTMGRSS